MTTLTIEQVEQLKKGQGVYAYSPPRGGIGDRIVLFVPIRSRKNGKIVRFMVSSKNPTGEKGDVS